jgi:hypothetical protein
LWDMSGENSRWLKVRRHEQALFSESSRNADWASARVDTAASPIETSHAPRIRDRHLSIRAPGELLSIDARISRSSLVMRQSGSWVFGEVELLEIFFLCLMACTPVKKYGDHMILICC